MFLLFKNRNINKERKEKMAICNNSMDMVIHQQTHQNNILDVSKCKQKEAHFVDFHTTYN